MYGHESKWKTEPKKERGEREGKKEELGEGCAAPSWKDSLFPDLSARCSPEGTMLFTPSSQVHLSGREDQAVDRSQWTQ